eukprot:scaffold135797_cov22-Tisochrysis_lutea.AAC.2
MWLVLAVDLHRHPHPKSLHPSRAARLPPAPPLRAPLCAYHDVALGLQEQVGGPERAPPAAGWWPRS